MKLISHGINLMKIPQSIFLRCRLICQWSGIKGRGKIDFRLEGIVWDLVIIGWEDRVRGTKNEIGEGGPTKGSVETDGSTRTEGSTIAKGFAITEGSERTNGYAKIKGITKTNGVVRDTIKVVGIDIVTEESDFDVREPKKINEADRENRTERLRGIEGKRRTEQKGICVQQTRHAEK